MTTPPAKSLIFLAALSELCDARHSSHANLPYASQVKDSAYGSADVSETAAASRSTPLMKDTAYDRTTSSSSRNVARRQRR